MMDSTKQPPKQNEESITITIPKSTRNALIARLLVILSLTGLCGYSVIKTSAAQYEAGQQLTQETYLAKFEEHKARLLNAKQMTNPAVVGLASFIVIAFLIGSYELMSLSIGLLVGKLIR
jgi:hypothetical protein